MRGQRGPIFIILLRWDDGGMCNGVEYWLFPPLLLPFIKRIGVETAKPPS